MRLGVCDLMEGLWHFLMLDWFVILSQEDKSQDVRLETGNKTDYQPFQLLSFENIENAQKQMKQILNAFF